MRNTSRMSPAVLASKGNCNNVNMIQKKIVVGLPKLFSEESMVLCYLQKKVFSLFYSEGRQLVGYIYRGWGKEKTIEGESWAELWQNFGGYFIHYSPSFFFTSSVWSSQINQSNIVVLNKKYSPSFCRSWKKKKTIKHFLKSLNFLLSPAVKSDGYSKQAESKGLRERSQIIAPIIIEQLSFTKTYKRPKGQVHNQYHF